ncbi:hypothetical protein MJ575_03365 [Klebsiella pneumoniae]|nr:hypothetical protein MJ575_03365 [Klebsiella pneumoniae]
MIITYSQGRSRNDGYGVRCITAILSMDKAPAALEAGKESGKM